MARPNRIVDHLGTGDETGRLPFDRNGRSGLPGPVRIPRPDEGKGLGGQLVLRRIAFLASSHTSLRSIKGPRTTMEAEILNVEGETENTS
jgi:hypothetical protein